MGYNIDQNIDVVALFGCDAERAVHRVVDWWHLEVATYGCDKTLLGEVVEAFTLGDLVLYLREKTGNDRTEKLREALRGAHIYRSEQKASENGCTYVLMLSEESCEAQHISPMYERAAPIAHLGSEVLSEHAEELSLDTLLSYTVP